MSQKNIVHQQSVAKLRKMYFVVIIRSFPGNLNRLSMLQHPIYIKFIIMFHFFCVTTYKT